VPRGGGPGAGVVLRSVYGFDIGRTDVIACAGWVAVGEATRSVGRGSGESPPDTDCCHGAGSVRSTAPGATTQTQRGVAWVTTAVGSEARGNLRSDIHNVRVSSDLLTAETLSSWCHVLKRTFS
jgi:hypothetical protein